MRPRLVVSLSIALLMALLSGSALPDKPTREELLSRANAAQGEKCAEACMEAAAALVEYSNDLFTNGEVQNAHDAMKDAVQYARRATDGSIQSKKRQKKTEIALRKLAKRMKDIDQTLAIDDRPEVENAVAAVEKMRTDLLMSLFSEK